MITLRLGTKIVEQSTSDYIRNRKKWINVNY